jgi:S1-C subfamily serine protease
MFRDYKITKSILFLLYCLVFAGCDEHVIYINPVDNLKPIEADLGGDYEAVQLKKVVCDIAIGKTIGHTNKQASSPVIFTPADEALFEKCIKKNFYSLFDNAGYETLGGTDSLFDEYENSTADLIIGAKIIDVRQNRKQAAQLLDWKLTIEQFIEIEWQVYSRQTKYIIGTFHSQGYYKDSIVFLYTIAPEQFINIIDNATRNSVSNLIANPEFIEILRNNEIVAAKDSKKQFIKKIYNYTKPINENSSTIRSSVISVNSTKGLGSGFIISEDGYALTNAHVVGSDSIVKVELATGREFLADVLSKEFERDVALLKIEQDGLVPLPINNSVISVGDEVYAMGSPLDVSLSSTLTKGIISAFRKDEDLEYIQSDVTVQKGNSGGPLMDEYGNVIGITVSGISFGGEIPLGLNFFIPITDAMQSLGIELKD